MVPSILRRLQRPDATSLQWFAGVLSGGLDIYLGNPKNHHTFGRVPGFCFSMCATAASM